MMKNSSKKILVPIISSTWIIFEHFFSRKCFSPLYKKQWKNNDGERETTQMKMKINFHSVPLWVALKYYTESCVELSKKRGTQERCQNEIPQFSLFSGRNVCSYLLTENEAKSEAAWKISRIQMIQHHYACGIIAKHFSAVSLLFAIFNLHKWRYPRL